jgi:hypothetical protein
VAAWASGLRGAPGIDGAAAAALSAAVVALEVDGAVMDALVGEGAAAVAELAGGAVSRAACWAAVRAWAAAGTCGGGGGGDGGG